MRPKRAILYSVQQVNCRLQLEHDGRTSVVRMVYIWKSGGGFCRIKHVILVECLLILVSVNLHELYLELHWLFI